MHRAPPAPFEASVARPPAARDRVPGHVSQVGTVRRPEPVHDTDQEQRLDRETRRCDSNPCERPQHACACRASKIGVPGPQQQEWRNRAKRHHVRLEQPAQQEQPTRNSAPVGADRNGRDDELAGARGGTEQTPCGGEAKAPFRWRDRGCVPRSRCRGTHWGRHVAKYGVSHLGQVSPPALGHLGATASRDPSPGNRG